jgi:hypothetical protein
VNGLVDHGLTSPFQWTTRTPTISTTEGVSTDHLRRPGT